MEKFATVQQHKIIFDKNIGQVLHLTSLQKMINIVAIQKNSPSNR